MHLSFTGGWYLPGYAVKARCVVCAWMWCSTRRMCPVSCIKIMIIDDNHEDLTMDYKDSNSNYCWISQQDIWLKIIFIAVATLMIVLLLALITHRCCRRQTRSHVYRTCSPIYLPPLNSVYGPTTCALDDEEFEVNNRHCQR